MPTGKWIGYRKLLLGLAYIVCVTALGLVAMFRSVDLVSVAALAASMATGVGVVVWGNVQVAKAEQTATPVSTSPTVTP